MTDELFHRDPRWVGGDGSSTVDLGDDRILWLFGDSWIDPTEQGQPATATMVSNSVAIQVGYDPSSASFKTYSGAPDSFALAPFITDDDTIRHWFGTGVLVDDRLVLFLARIQNTDSGIGFEAAGWTAWIVDNPEDEPSAWKKLSAFRETRKMLNAGWWCFVSEQYAHGPERSCCCCSVSCKRDGGSGRPPRYYPVHEIVECINLV